MAKSPQFFFIIAGADCPFLCHLFFDAPFCVQLFYIILESSIFAHPADRFYTTTRCRGRANTCRWPVTRS